MKLPLVSAEFFDADDERGSVYKSVSDISDQEQNEKNRPVGQPDEVPHSDVCEFYTFLILHHFYVSVKLYDVLTIIPRVLKTNQNTKFIRHECGLFFENRYNLNSI